MIQLALLNGEVITVNQDDEISEACLIEGNKIVAVGTTDEIKSKMTSSATEIDLEGKTVLPGLIDAHLHLFLYGNTLIHLNCKEPEIQSIEELLEKIGDRVTAAKKGEVIRVFGFNELMMKEERYPTLQELDQLTNEHPIIITRTCSHIGVANSAALTIMEIDEDRPNPSGGTIEKDSEGRLTGRLIESAFLDSVQKLPYSEEELLEALDYAEEKLFSYGITSVHDAGGFDGESFSVMQNASYEKRFKARIYAMIGTLNDCEKFMKNMVTAGVVTHTGNDFFKIGPAKLFTDGSSTGPTIATREPYTSDGDNYGYLMYTEDELYSLFETAHKRGYQLTVHAQGDQAIEQYLNVIERLVAAYPRGEHRHRVEHLGVCPPDLQSKAKALNVIPVLNPSFPYEFGESYLHNYGERTNYMYAAKDLIDQDVVVTAGSDAPITTVNPFTGIYMAMARKTKKQTAFGQQQKVALMDAIRMYTINAAYSSFDEHRKGSIEVGKLADLAILDRSLLNCPIEEIPEIRAEMTLIDGEIVHQLAKEKELS